MRVRPVGGVRARGSRHRRLIALSLALGLLAGCGGVGAEVPDAGAVGPARAPVESGAAPDAQATPEPTAPSTAEPTAALPPGAVAGIVTSVVDGDTVDVAGVGRIRVIGIDTPERGACGFDSATYSMSVLVLGREVTLVPGAVDDADRYGRLLRYVDVGPVDAGLRLIEDGWAIARYDSRDGYGRHAREDTYVAADLAAPDLGCYPDDEP